jgi:hypothetical protein
MSRLLSTTQSGLFLLTVSAGLLVAGCRSKAPQQARLAYHVAKPQAPDKPQNPVPPPAAPGAEVPDARYQTFVRPLLNHLGCTSANCHGMMKGGGLFIATGNVGDLVDYKTILARLDRKEPEKSELVQKALGKIQHNGGRNIDENSCDFKRLIAWIGEKPEPECQDPPGPDLQARFTREVKPALVSLGCATDSCHGGEVKARAKLDFYSFFHQTALPARAYLSFQATPANHYTAWLSPVILAANAADDIHKQPADKLSCAYRRLYGYTAGSPESTCALPGTATAAAKDQAKPPDLAAFEKVVLPTITKRGCLDVGCHGGGAGGMSLFVPNTSAPTILHDYLALTARVEDFAHPDKSTLLRTARNQEPHGGGQRIGGHGDCVDDVFSGWLLGRPVKPCPPPEPPTYASFVKVVQPVLDKMTCTNPQCHGGAIDLFTIMPHPLDPKVLRANYAEVLKHIDYDFMPLSGIMLRMREPCAYSVVGAWIEKKPAPSCLVHDPDPSIFPRRDPRGNIMHPKFAPDSSAAPTKT